MNPYQMTFFPWEFKRMNIQGDAEVIFLDPEHPDRPETAGNSGETLTRVILKNHLSRIELVNYEKNEEGYSRHDVTVEWNPDVEAWEIEDATKSKDCDGPHGQYWSGRSPGGVNSAWWNSPDETTSQSVYDEFARAAGY